MEKVLIGVGAVIGFFALVTILALLLAYPTLWAVNYLFAPSAILAVFGVPQLTFWKALMLNYMLASVGRTSPSSSK